MLLSDFLLSLLVFFILSFIVSSYIRIMVTARKIKYRGGWLALYVDLHKRMIPFAGRKLRDVQREVDEEAISALERSLVVGFVLMMVFSVLFIIMAVFLDIEGCNLKIF